MKNDRVSVPPLTAASDMGRRRSGNAAKALLRDGHEASSSDGDFTLACSGDSMEADEPSSVTELLAQKLSMQDVVFVEVKAERTPSRQSWKIPARDSDEESDIFFFIDEDTEALDSKPRKGGNSLNTRQSATPAKPKQLKPAAARAVASEEADARQELADDEDIERDFLAEDLAEPPATTPATAVLEPRYLPPLKSRMHIPSYCKPTLGIPKDSASALIVPGMMRAVP
ncbi:hypothetical protein DIPPA_23642 [Diplonema papillatum]|nr:hypothetical protein DIPPA_23642 [Diplonema papillatum]